MKFLIILGFAEDLLPFRGDFIDALLERGMQVHVALPDLEANSDLHSKLLAKGLVVHKFSMQRAGMNPIADFHTMWQLLKLMWDIRPEVVLVNYIKPVIYGMMAASIARVPHRFALISGLGYAFTGENNQRGLLRRLAQWLYTLSLRGAHKTFFENPDDCKLFYQLGILKPNALSCVVNYWLQDCWATKGFVNTLLPPSLSKRNIHKFVLHWWVGLMRIPVLLHKWNWIRG